MIVVVTGMVGLDKKRYLDDVARRGTAQGQTLTQFNVGDMMYREGPDIPPGKILDIPMPRLNSLRRCVFKDIITQSRDAEHVIVNTHATFRWRHGLFPAVDFDQMRELNADLYICLLDCVASLHQRLLAEHVIDHTLKDLMVWREEEIIGTDMLRRGVGDNIPFFCLARGNQRDTVETFYDLLFARDKQKAYLSFPMTAVAGQPAIQAEIDAFREQMNSILVCFDPADVEDAHLPQLAQEARDRGSDTVELIVQGNRVDLSCAEILQIERDINSQTYARDFLLIDQADMIVSFIPAGTDGRASISSGVERELQHAHEAGKEVYVIWTAEQRPSVFVTQTATGVFRSVREAMAHFAPGGVSR